MTKQEAIEIIKRACVEANPSIMDLTFGCEMQTIFGKVIYVDSYGKTEWKEADTIAYLQEGELFKREISEKGFAHFFEILGRPITLADILLTGNISLTHGDYRELEGYLLNQGGLYHWNLRKDSLHEQSEATLLFLAGLLKK